jgi:hypothetical protein
MGVNLRDWRMGEEARGIMDRMLRRRMVELSDRGLADKRLLNPAIEVSIPTGLEPIRTRVT